MMLRKKEVDRLSEIEDGFVVKINDEYIFLSREAKLVWEISGKTHSTAEILEVLSAQYSDINEPKLLDLLKTLEAHGLVEILDEREVLHSKKRENQNMRPLKKFQILRRRNIEPIFRILEPVLSPLAQDKWIVTIYIMPWLVFLFFIVFMKFNPFLEIAYMNYAMVVFLIPIILLHELAHAVVSEKLGAEVNGFGLGIYKIIPFLYTDTAETLLLKRKDRMKVSLAGPAVNFVSGFAFTIASVISGSKDLFILASLVFLLGLNSLVPVFESDGYYVMMDYGYLNNPSKEALLYLRSVFKKGSGKWKRKQKVVLAAYMSSYSYSIVLIVYFCLFFLPIYVNRLRLYLYNLFSLSTYELVSFSFGILYLALLALLAGTLVSEKLKPVILGFRYKLRTGDDASHSCH